jgi:hypothetical protein
MVTVLACGERAAEIIAAEEGYKPKHSRL